jgi:hypothetical protein
MPLASVMHLRESTARHELSICIQSLSVHSVQVVGVGNGSSHSKCQVGLAAAVAAVAAATVEVADRLQAPAVRAFLPPGCSCAFQSCAHAKPEPQSCVQLRNPKP